MGANSPLLVIKCLRPLTQKYIEGIFVLVTNGNGDIANLNTVSGKAADFVE
jgi:hypothetical protein